MTDLKLLCFRRQSFLRDTALQRFGIYERQSGSTRHGGGLGRIARRMRYFARPVRARDMVLGLPGLGVPALGFPGVGTTAAGAGCSGCEGEGREEKKVGGFHRENDRASALSRDCPRC